MEFVNIYQFKFYPMLM